MMSHFMQGLINEDNLNQNEKVINQFIKENLDKISSMSSRELAKETYTSSTAIVRFVRKLGFENYNDFKINIVSYLKHIEVSETIVAKNDELLTVVNKMSTLQTSVIKQTTEWVSMSQLREVSDLLNKVSYIDIVASDANADIAEYASHNLFIVKKLVTVYKNKDKQIYLGLNAPSDHAVIIMSKHGDTKRFIDLATNLKKRNVKTIGLITDQSQGLGKLTDYQFKCAFNHSINSLGDLVYNISTKYIFDLLFSSLFSLTFDEILVLEDTHRTLFRKEKA